MHFVFGLRILNWRANVCRISSLFAKWSEPNKFQTARNERQQTSNPVVSKEHQLCLFGCTAKHQIIFKKCLGALLAVFPFNKISHCSVVFVWVLCLLWIRNKTINKKISDSILLLLIVFLQSFQILFFKRKKIGKIGNI